MWKNVQMYCGLSGKNMHKAIKAFSLGSNDYASAVEWHCLNSTFKEGKKGSFCRTPAPLPTKAVKNNSKLIVNLNIVRCNVLTILTWKTNMPQYQLGVFKLS